MKRLFTLLFSLLVLAGSAQDTSYVRQLMETLCSPDYFGRGYYKQGDQLAAKFLIEECKEIGLQTVPGMDSYEQVFTIPMNVIEEKVVLKVDGKELQGGVDFMVSAAGPDHSGEVELVYLKPSYYKSYKKFEKIFGQRFKDKYLVLDPSLTEDKDIKDFCEKVQYVNILKAKGYIILEDKVKWWSVSDATKMKKYSVIKVNRKSFEEQPESVVFDFQKRFYQKYECRNIIAWLPGKTNSDSIIMLGGHYDHLGQMGKDVLFPGANDNMSGVGFCLDMARYYADTNNRLDYGMLFVLFAAEESGLFGSKHFAKNPPVDLKQVKVFMNMDMVGTGSKGITIINGKVFEADYNQLVKINEENKLLPLIKARGEAPNSDHYPLYERGVKSMFIYTMGHHYKEYHSVNDKAKDVPLTGYNSLFKLLQLYFSSF